jgi:hypothetical protein
MTRDHLVICAAATQHIRATIVTRARLLSLRNMHPIGSDRATWDMGVRPNHNVEGSEAEAAVAQQTIVVKHR